MTIGGCFECYMYRVTVQGWLKKEERKMKNSDLKVFQVCHFKIVTKYCYYTTADWGNPYNLLYVLLSALCTFRYEHLFPGDDTTIKNANTLIGAAILFYFRPSLHVGYATASP